MTTHCHKNLNKSNRVLSSDLGKIKMELSENNGKDANVDNVVEDNNTPGDPQSGIDISKALDILSARAPHKHHEKPPPPELRSMGQVIDIFATPSKNSPQSSSESMKQDKPVTQSAAANTVNPAEQRKKIRESLKNIPFIALLKMIFTAQEDRVRTYRLYDEALEKVLLSNRLTDYPPACVAATAAFAVLSNTVSAVRDEVRERADNGKDQKISKATASSVIKLIGDLQDSERKKLQLTAAYHLEQIRANNLKQSTNENSGEDDNDGDVDMRELSLLNNGIASLHSQIETCRSNINDVIDDLRCTLLEQMEEEEDK